MTVEQARARYPKCETVEQLLDEADRERVRMMD